MRTQQDLLLHSFRGFAILFIVAIHGFGIMIYYAGKESPTIPVGMFYTLKEIIFHNGTIFFALISGILFSYILANKGWASFFKSKLFNVIFPYLFFTALFTFFFWNVDGELKLVFYSGGVLEFFSTVWHNFIYGKALFSFWYMPVLLVLYLLTPPLFTIIKNRNLHWLILPIVLMPLVTSRFWPEMVWTNFAYFTGVYMVGLYAGANYPEIINKLDSNVLALFNIAIITTLILGLMFIYKIDKWQFISLRESVWYIQKLAFAGLILVFSKRYIEKIPTFIYTLGNYAFPIFFMHAYFMSAAYVLLRWLGFQITNYFVLAVSCIALVILVILLCLIISKACQLIFKRRSRQLIGV